MGAGRCGGGGGGGVSGQPCRKQLNDAPVK